LDIRRRICGGNHALVAQSENNLATLLRQTDRFDEAEQHYTSALEIRRQVFGPRHPETAEALHNLANLLLSRGNPEEAESHFREAIDILQQVPGGRFPSITESWHGLAMIGIEKGEYTQAEDLLRQAIALEQKHGFSASYHHQVTLANLLRTRLGRPSEALLLYAEAIQVIERLRLQVGGDELDRARYSSQLARWEAFGGMARAQLAAIGKNSEHGVRKAFDYLERGRGRALLDLLDRSGQNMFETAAARADQSEATAREIATTRLAAVQAKAREVAAERQIETTEQDDTRDEPEKAERLLQLQKERDAARDAERVALRRLYDLARDGLRSQGLKPMVALEVAAGLLKPGELLLLYDIGEADALLLVLQSGGGASAFWLSWPDGNMVTQSSLAERVNRIMARIRSNTPQSTDLQASEADNLAELASALLPSALQPKLRVASCLFLVPDGPLDELPFEVLPLSATPAAQSLRDGPPIVYGPSATVLATLRAKGRQRDVERVAVGQTTLLAVGDPVFDRTFKKSSPSIPERGILVTDVAAGSSAARSGIGSGDVILRYDGQEVNDTEALKHAIQRRPAPGPTTAPSEPSPGDLVPVQVWRGDGNQEFRVAVGPLGVTASTRPMPEALQAYREPKRSDADRHASVSYRRTRDGFGGLDSLPGTRREANAIAQVIRASGASQDSCRILLGEEATLGNLEARSDHPRFLHLATHGLAGGWRPEENALAFTVPLDPTPTDDGFLRLSDLLYQWGGRLDRTELVVLSACRTAAGPRAAGEGLMALTWGFLFAGADSVVASLWEADDQATALLMQRFYQNLLGLFAESRAGYVPKTPMPKCVALLEAKRWLSTSSPQENRRQLESMGFEVDGRQQPRIPKSDVLPSKAPQLLENPTNFSDPYYWAGFVLIGDPD
jgi:tetratricopeptide (TPR) repeat protein